VHIITGHHAGQLVFIPRITLTHSQGLSFEFRCCQFPVRLAFAMTINKSQGQSLGTVGLDLCQPVFSHGQLYGAVSRGTTWHRIKILLEGNVTQNIVYPDVCVDYVNMYTFLKYFKCFMQYKHMHSLIFQKAPTMNMCIAWVLSPSS